MLIFGAVLRGDLPRLSRSTSIITSTPSAVAAAASSLANGEAPTLTNIKRSKPLKYAYEKEIVLYAYHKNLDYFSTECIYSPEAFRGSARALIKNLERVRPSAILDVVRSGEDMARLVPGYEASCAGSCTGHAVVGSGADVEEQGGCGSTNGRSTGGEMAKMEQGLVENEIAEVEGLETEIKLPPKSKTVSKGRQNGQKSHIQQAKRTPNKQTMGQCEKCGYLSSQKMCKACVLLEGLNKNNPKVEMQGPTPQDVPGNESLEDKLTRSMAHMGMG
jgi:cytoplasmic tRNA 2-thiolation protein 1